MTSQPALLELDDLEVLDEVTTAPAPAPPVYDGPPPVWVTYPFHAPDQMPDLPADPRLLIRMILDYKEHLDRTVHPALRIDTLLGYSHNTVAWYAAARRYLEHA